MSAVPYTFANNYGNIPLSELDTNFANCKAFANTAGYVTENAQPAITSVGVLTTLSVSGNTVSGNVSTGGFVTVSARATGNLSVIGNTVMANLVVGNVSASGEIIAVGNIGAPNMSIVGNIYTGQLYSAGPITTFGNLEASNVTVYGQCRRLVDIILPNYVAVNETNGFTLSNVSSINILVANNTGYTATLSMPVNPADGQICNFAVSGNTLTLAVGTGTVLPTFAGSTSVGTGYRYVYRVSNTSWYRIG